MNSARPIATFPPPANGSTQKWTDGPARLSPPRHHPPPPRSLPAILPRTRRLRRPARRATDPRDARRVLTRPRREDAARRGDPTNGPVSHVEREEEGWRSHARSAPLPGVTDYGDLRRRARASRYPTSDCSQEKSGKSRRCRPISALLNENRLHHGRGRARASHPSARFWAVPVGAGCPLAHPLAPSVSHGRPSIEERVRLEFRSLPHRRRTPGRALASRQRVDKAGTLPVKARWWPSR